MFSKGKILITVGTILLAILIFSIGVWIFLQTKSRYAKYQPWETESILSTIGENTSYDLLLMGSSHGRLFSRNRNHLLVEKVLGRKTATIAGGSSCIIPAQIFLDLFYAKKNTADTILYFIDPWCFYSDKYNSGYIFEHEPFDVQLLIAMLRYHVDPKIIKNYLSRTLRQGQKPYVIKDVQPRTEQLESVDSQVVNDRLLDLYEGDITRKPNPKYLETFQKINLMAEKHNSEIQYIIPPTLYFDPHHTELKDILNQNNLKYIDMSESITDPVYYYDHDHLNAQGVRLFLELLQKEIDLRKMGF